MENNINTLISNLDSLVMQIKTLHDDMFLHSVKDATYRKYTMQVRKIMDSLNNVLETLPNLKELDIDMYLCYDNDIYLSYMKNKYIISRIKDGKVKILGYTPNLQKALELFYSKAYNSKKKELKKKDINNIYENNIDN